VTEKSSDRYLGSICDESLTCLGLNSNLKRFVCFIFSFVLCGESRLLLSWCAGDRYGMVCNDEHHDRSRTLGAEDREWSSIGWKLSGRTIERSGDAVCGLYHARGDGKSEFLG
jgi:hypothetical protein